MSESTEQVAAKVEAPVDTTTIVETNTEYPPSVHKVHRQLLAIFDPENIAKDNFFRELVERTPEGCKGSHTHTHIETQSCLLTTSCRGSHQEVVHD